MRKDILVYFVYKSYVMDYKVILLELQKKWNVQKDGTWIPICWEMSIPWVQIYDTWTIENQLKSILKDILNIDCVIEINENREVKEIKIDKINFQYDWIEHFYTDYNYNFLIYVSHEDTITIGSDKINNFIRT